MLGNKTFYFFKAAVRNFFGLKMIRNQYLRKYITSQCSKLSPEAPFTLQATLSDKATRSHSFQWRAGDFRRHERQRPLATGWGVSSDATKFRILQLYANEERLSGATANRKEDGWAHVIVLLSAVDKHTQWKKSRLCFSFIFVCMSVFNLYIIFSLLPPKCLYLAARNLIRCLGNQ